MATMYGVNFDAIALEKTPKILKKVYNTKGRLMQMFKKDTTRIEAGGKYARIPLHVGGNVNDGTRRVDMQGSARLMPAYGDGQQFDEGRVNITNYYHSHYLDRAKVDALKGNNDAIIELIAFEMDKGMSDAVKQINRLLHRDGTGLICELVSDANSATQQICMCGADLKTGGNAVLGADYINGVPMTHLRKNKQYQVIKWTAGTGKFNYVAPTATANDAITLSSMNINNRTITLSSAVDTSAAADRFFLAEFGNVYCEDKTTFISNDPLGLISLVNQGNIKIRGAAAIENILDNSKVCDIDAVSKDYWNSKGNYATVLRDWSEHETLKLLQMMDFEGLEDWKNFVMMLNPDALLKIATILEDDTQKMFYETLEGGYRLGKFRGLNADVGFVEDWDAAENTIRGFKFDYMLLATIIDDILNWDNFDGQIWTTGKINRQDAIMAMIYARFNAAITARNQSFVYNALDNSVTP